MGVVYRAVGPGGERAAVKVVRTHLASAEARRRFEREAGIRIDHPNVVRVLETGVDPDDQTPFIALELLDGENLEQRIARGALRCHEVVAIGLQACEGLAAAHARGVIHRDLKPSNLFLCQDGTVKLLDFGIALLTTRETRITSEGGVLGTPAYMSPEQVQGQLAVDARTDIWSLGAVLYEALSGRTPFLRETPLAIMLAVLMEEPEPLWSRTHGAPPGLCAAIERALAKRVELRWGTPEELREALREVDASGPSPTAPTSRPPEPDAAMVDTISMTSLLPPPVPNLIPAGEHRIVAVLLAEGVRSLPVFGAAVRQHGGSLLQLLGRRAIGLFGGETWEGDEVARAASAALAARPAAERMAVASGRATSSAGGISGGVLRAAEEGCAAALDGVAVDAASARTLEDMFLVHEAGGGPGSAAPGSAAPEPLGEVWEITGRRSVESRRGRGADREAPLLGRDAELAQLRAGIRRVVEEQQHAVLLLSGPPGIGKTRLRREIEAHLAGLGEPIVTLSARAEPLRRESAVALVGAALRSHPRLEAALQEEGNAAVTLEARRAAIAELAAEAIEGEQAAREHAQFLGELLGVPMPETPALRAARADPQLMMDRLRLALLDLFEGLAGRGVVALLLEDLQWADRASLAFLDDLLDRLADAPLLVLATARSELLERQPQLFAGRNVTRVEPRGLISSDVAALSAWIAGRALPEALARAIAERTAGHPLFVEQIVLALRDRDLLGGEVDELPMTPTVEAAVQSRLDHLPPAEKDACKRAAVLDRPFTAEELEAMGVAGAAAVLGSLGRRDLVAGRARPGGRGRVFSFRSALVADVAYGMIADDARRELHRRAALYLSGQASAEDEEIASHFERGGEPAQATERYAAAALGAARRGDTPSVLRCSERALSLGVRRELRFALHMARADALRFLGKREEQTKELALSLEHASNDAELARVLTERAVLMMRTGKRPDAIAEAEAAVAAAERAGDPEVLTAARARHVGALIYGGRVQQAREAFEAAMLLADKATPRTRAFLADVRAQLAGALGDLGERQLAFQEAVALYREAGDIRRAAGTEANLADVYNRIGAYAEAEAALQQVLEGGRRVNNRMMEGYALANLGYARSMQGSWSAALRALEEALAIATATSEVRLGLTVRLYRARTRLASGDTEGVAAAARAVVSEAHRVGELGVRAIALTVAAGALLATGDVAGAVSSSAEAMSALHELGGVEEDEAEIFVTHARALELSGREAEAAEVRRRGSERVAQIAERISDLRWRERFIHGVPAHRELIGAPPTGR